MTNKDKKFFIPVSGQWVEVSEEIYYEYYRPIWRTHEYAQRHGQCRCRKSDIWKCDGICQGCEFYTAGNQISFDGTVDEEEDDDLMLENAIADEASPLEEIITDMELLDALYEELEHLEPERRQICELLMQYSEREAAEMMGIPRSTFKRKWSRVQKYLKARLKKYYE